MIDISEADFDNVFLYVADAVRWDSLPESVSARGQTVKTIASSIHTPTSFSSIVSGLYPPQHAVRQFGDKLDPDLLSLFSIDGVNAVFTNTINEEFNENPHSESILDRTLGTKQVAPKALEGINPPFIFVERGPGGHAPYGGYDGNAWEYFRDRRGSPQDQYHEEYKQSVEHDATYFSSRLNLLDDRDVLDNTLVIYTSDHGELLGDNGILGHNSPIHPSLVYVPTVFIHPSFNDSTASGLLRHVDLFPTLCSLFGTDAPSVPGQNLTTDSLSGRGACFYTKSFQFNAPLISGELSFESLWDSDGGYVFTTTGTANNAVILTGKLMKSAKREFMRRHLREVALTYLSRRRMYGEPGFSISECRRHLKQIHNLPKRDRVRSSIDDEAEQRLRELGYMN